MPNAMEAKGAGSATAITKNDSTVYQPFDALYVGGAGAVAVRTFPGAQVVTFAGVAAGTVLPVRCDKVMSTNTDATSIVGLRF